MNTNSETRADRVLGTLRALDPTLTVVNQTRQSSRDAVALAAASPPERSPAAPDTPEMAAVLAQFVRDYERKWLDEPISSTGCFTRR